MKSQLKPIRTGFTLIEVALAIVVLALGLLAVFSLLSIAMDTSAKASADTQAGLFADSVMNTFRAESEQAAENGQWDAFWQDGITNLPVAYPDAWVGDLFIQTNSLCNLTFINNPFRPTTITNVVNHSLRYSLEVDPPQSPGDKACVLLKVWNGQFGPANDDNAFVFYSEFRKEGDL